MPAAFFHACLGPRMKYSSCLYEQPGDTLAIAEERALAATCANADLQDGQSILELGLRRKLGLDDTLDGGALSQCPHHRRVELQ